MVDVAQLVERRIVIPVVAGSSPVFHPTFAFSLREKLRRGKPTFLKLTYFGY
jgi:hypothetical protein